MKKNISVGIFLATRQIIHTNKWATFLIILVMSLTFLNLTVVSGILNGLVAGSSDAYRRQYSGDVLVSTAPNKGYIPNSKLIVSVSKTIPHVESVSSRFIGGSFVESNYKKIQKSNEENERVAATFVGIDPFDENSVTGLSKLIIKGEYLNKDSENEIIIGSSLIKEYAGTIRPGGKSLSNIEIGKKILVTVGDYKKEFTVKGILKSKIGEVGNRIYVIDKIARKLLNRYDYNADEISIKINEKEEVSQDHVRDELLALASEIGFINDIKIQTWEDAQGQFFKDLGRTFSILGNFIGVIGLMVSSITLFIVIFINAITRKRYIGILKGIGIKNYAIQISYILQAFFYSAIGSIIGLSITYSILIPFFLKNPIDFPFSDGILIAPVEEVIVKMFALVLSACLAGYVPAKLITRGNTLDAILGR